MNKLAYEEHILDYANYTKLYKNTNFKKELEKFISKIVNFFKNYENDKYLQIATDKYIELMLTYENNITEYKYASIEKYKILFYNHSILYSLYLTNEKCCNEIEKLFDIFLNIINETYFK